MPTKVTVTFSREEVDDTDPDLSYLRQEYDEPSLQSECAKYKEQDAVRLAAYYRGDWHCVGIRAKATIRIDYLPCRENGHQRFSYFHELTSPGLWGIESDSSAEYFAEVYAEECAQLRSDIKAMKLAEFKEVQS